MSAWMNDAAPNHNGNGFPHISNDQSIAPTSMMDPSAFMANPAQQYNQQQFNNQQQQQMAGLQNGPMRNASPSSFQNPVYQTNSVIPSKRPRPREDSLAASPRQNSGMLPTSRSETPQQQNFQGFQPGAMPQQTPNQFSHLQPNGSANASPSPIMGNQMRPGSVPQRVSTASPHPFSPGAQQQFGGTQTSPVPSEHGTPQPNQFMQNMPQGFNPNFAPSPSNPRPSPNPTAMPPNQMMSQQMGQIPNMMYAQMQGQQQPPQQGQQQQQPPQPQSQQQQQQQQQHQQGGQQQRPQGMPDHQKMAAYQMRLQQQLQGNIAQAQIQAQGMGRGMMGKQQMPGMPNGQIPPGARPQARSMAAMNPDQFMKSLSNLMQQRGLPLDQNPAIGDRSVNLMMLFQAVQARGGHKNVTMSNGWAQVAQHIGIQPQAPNIPPMVKQIYERNLQTFEEVWQMSQKQRMQQQANTMANQGTPQKSVQPGMQMSQGQVPPNAQPPTPQQQTPVKPGQPPMNGFPTPQPQSQGTPTPGQNRNSMLHGMQPSPGNEFPMASPASRKGGSISMSQAGPQAPLSNMPEDPVMPRPQPKSDVYEPSARELTTYGGVDLHALNMLGAELERWKPDMPPIMDLGNIDVAALTRSLESGIHGEVRLALDTLAGVSASPAQQHYLQLRYCEDLVEALVDCAEEQLEQLTEATVEVSDEIQLTPYEELVRICRTEQWTVRDVSAFGTSDYNLDRAVDRLICVTTILRNVSFGSEQNENHGVLAQDFVINFLTDAIRFLGTRTMLLRTHTNTLDFMKDVVVLLSNIAGSVEIPGREQAFSLLQFLLAFAPTPAPTLVDDALQLGQYEPSLHVYLPHAVDALAKLLARDEPNRTHYKTIFSFDTTSAANSLSQELLTRTFALAISPIPDKGKEWSRPMGFPSLVEVRKPFLMQGFLSAEILASIIPSHDTALARLWLSSGNGLAHVLFRFIQELTHTYERLPAFARGARPPRKDPELVYLVVVAVSLLRRLIEKARDQNDPSSTIPPTLLPPEQALMEALSMPSPDWTKEGFLQQLTAVANLSR